MKVLEKRRKQTGWAGEYRCTGKGNGNGGCNALLLVEQGDLFQTRSSDYGGGVDYYTTFQCPECRRCTDITDCPVRDLPLKYI